MVFGPQYPSTVTVALDALVLPDAVEPDDEPELPDVLDPLDTAFPVIALTIALAHLSAFQTLASSLSSTKHGSINTAFAFVCLRTYRLLTILTPAHPFGVVSSDLKA